MSTISHSPTRCHRNELTAPPVPPKGSTLAHVRRSHHSYPCVIAALRKNLTHLPLHALALPRSTSRSPLLHASHAAASQALECCQLARLLLPGLGSALARRGPTMRSFFARVCRGFVIGFGSRGAHGSKEQWNMRDTRI
jgi:hypothetical protein